MEGRLVVEECDPDPLEAALSPDDTGSLSTSSREGELVVEFGYDSLSTCVNSLDDLTRCLKTAMEVSNCD